MAAKVCSSPINMGITLMSMWLNVGLLVLECVEGLVLAGMWPSIRL